MQTDRILIIPDLHQPYAHIDTVKFLSAVRDYIKPTITVCLGDEVDLHSISYHEKDPDLFGPAHELAEAIKRLQPLYELFPRVEILNSNHGSFVARKIKSAGLASAVVRSVKEILKAPKGWTWQDELVLTTPDKQKVLFSHGMNANALKMSQSLGMSVVFGHFHSSYYIQYWASPSGLFWAMQSGCLIDPKSMAFAYNKADLRRPILGCSAIIDSRPMLIPMVLSKGGRWVGKL